ncbi:tetraacyldisaccharide 4'-kinase [Mesorhizobium sp. KR1-2]|uniref:tetraacyldisaccharide 4'-kinase n=1 Tax=Mesorhizobium sp. KR1-2 TaxID=3156609 RepID=UPI0032B5400D
MASEAPPFWWERPDWRAYALWPFSALYGLVASRLMLSARRERFDLPVLCVGNFTVGGSGKTPVAIALAREARRMGLRPGFLSRGHGGNFGQPHIVDAHHDSAKHVGDEPLLLAEHAPVAVTPSRAAGAKLLLEQGCDFLIMDDGFQSAHIHFDYALLVVDARYGIGNGHVIPGGPLRAPLVQQMRFADAVLKMGEGTAADGIVRKASRAGKAVFEAVARPRDAEAFAGGRFLAFAGIGHPEKFFDTVARAGGTVVRKRSFGDHHVYEKDELDDLVAMAKAEGLELVTTAKDAARLRHDAPQGFLDRLRVLEIDAAFDLKHAPARIIGDTVDAWRRRQPKT